MRGPMIVKEEIQIARSRTAHAQSQRGAFKQTLIDPV